MTEADIQQLLQKQPAGGMTDPTNIFTSVLEPLMPMLTLFFVLGIVMTLVIVIFFTVNTVQKQRQHSAIMRIDRNLQKIVDAQELSGSARNDGNPVPAADSQNADASAPS